MKILIKLLYVLTRSSAIFSFPVLKKIRNWSYRKYFNVQGISVSDFVLIASAHRSDKASISLGKNFEAGRLSYIDYSGGIVVGDNVTLSEQAKVFTHNHCIRSGNENWHLNPIEFSSLVIENNVWIGANAIIAPNVSKIGHGAIIGAGAVLTKDAVPNGIYVGNPAELKRYREVEQ